MILPIDDDALFLDQCCRFGGWTLFNDMHFAIDVVALHSTEALDHAAAELEIHPGACLFVLGDQGKFFGATETASEWKPALLGVTVGFRVMINAERALFTPFALSKLPSTQSSSHSIVMARGAVVACATRADEECDGAAVHALPVHKLVAMLLTHVLPVAKLLGHTRTTVKILLLQTAL